MSFKENMEEEFYEQAVEMMMRWLGDEERSVLREEFWTNGVYFDALSASEKLMGILRFIEINYIQVPKRIAMIEDQLMQITKITNGKFSIKELEVPETAEEYVSLSDLREISSGDSLQKIFREFLETTRLLEPYKIYVNRLPYKEDQSRL
jgi:hypothetical protein